jgi:hypothetical protein
MSVRYLQSGRCPDPRPPPRLPAVADLPQHHRRVRPGHRMRCHPRGLPPALHPQPQEAIQHGDERLPTAPQPPDRTCAIRNARPAIQARTPRIASSLRSFVKPPRHSSSAIHSSIMSAERPVPTLARALRGENADPVHLPATRRNSHGGHDEKE